MLFNSRIRLDEMCFRWAKMYLFFAFPNSVNNVAMECHEITLYYTDFVLNHDPGIILIDISQDSSFQAITCFVAS